MVIPNTYHRVYMEYRQNMRNSRLCVNNNNKSGAATAQRLVYIMPGRKSTFRLGNLQPRSEYQAAPSATAAEMTDRYNNSSNYSMMQHQQPDYQLYLAEEVNSLKSQLNSMEKLMRQNRENMLAINLDCPFPGCQLLKVPLWCRQRLLDHLRDEHGYCYDDCRHALSIMQQLDQKSLTWHDEVHGVLSKIHDLKVNSNSSQKTNQNAAMQTYYNQNRSHERNEVVTRQAVGVSGAAQHFKNSESNFQDQGERTAITSSEGDTQAFPSANNTLYQSSPKVYTNCPQPQTSTPSSQYIDDHYQKNRPSYVMNNHQISREKCYRDFIISSRNNNSNNHHHQINHGNSQYRSQIPSNQQSSQQQSQIRDPAFEDLHQSHQNNSHHKNSHQQHQTTPQSANSNSATVCHSSLSSSSHSPSANSANGQPSMARHHQQQQSSGVETKKPPQTYASLIRSAIQSSPSGSLNLAEIYDWISERHPFFDKNKMNWKNAVRHNLSLYGYFVRVKTPWMKGSSRWTIDNDLLRENMSRKRPSNDYVSPGSSDASGCEKFTNAADNRQQQQHRQECYGDDADQCSNPANNNNCNGNGEGVACKRMKIVLPHSDYQSSVNKQGQAESKQQPGEPNVETAQQSSPGENDDEMMLNGHLHEKQHQSEQNLHSNLAGDELCDDDTTILTDDGLIVDDSTNVPIVSSAL